MNTILLLISINVIAANFLESFIAYKRLQEERKSLFNPLLQKIKLQDEVWLPFIITVVWVAVANYFISIYFNSLPFHLLFFITCLFTTALHLGAAHSNYYRRPNFITQKLLQ